jgi:hypothetical protein
MRRRPSQSDPDQCRFGYECTSNKAVIYVGNNLLLYGKPITRDVLVCFSSIHEELPEAVEVKVSVANLAAWKFSCNSDLYSVSIVWKTNMKVLNDCQRLDKLRVIRALHDGSHLVPTTLGYVRNL